LIIILGEKPRLSQHLKVWILCILKTYETKKGKNNFNIVEMKWYEDLRYNRTLDGLKGRSREIEFTFKSYTNGLRMVGNQHLVGMNKCV
jgi:hypothetical protein